MPQCVHFILGGLLGVVQEFSAIVFLQQKGSFNPLGANLTLKEQATWQESCFCAFHPPPSPLVLIRVCVLLHRYNSYSVLLTATLISSSNGDAWTFSCKSHLNSMKNLSTIHQFAVYIEAILPATHRRQYVFFSIKTFFLSFLECQLHYLEKWNKNSLDHFDASWTAVQDRMLMRSSPCVCSIGKILNMHSKLLQ